MKLLQEKPIEKVTVTEICRSAEINRTTFYKYYDNPYDLMEKLQSEFLAQLEQKLITQSATDLRPAFQIVLEEAQENLDFFRYLYTDSSDRSFREELFALCYQPNMERVRKLRPELDEKRQNWLYFFIAEGLNGILKQWILNGLEQPAEEIAEFAENLVERLTTAG